VYCRNKSIPFLAEVIFIKWNQIRKSGYFVSTSSDANPRRFCVVIQAPIYLQHGYFIRVNSLVKGICRIARP